MKIQAICFYIGPNLCADLNPPPFDIQFSIFGINNCTFDTIIKACSSIP